MKSAQPKIEISFAKILSSTRNLFIVVVVISFILRLIGLNLMGHTWDEYAYVGVGDDYLRLIAAGDFNDEEWYSFPDHPPFSRYFYGLAGFLSVTSRAEDGAAIYAYDWTAPRVVAALFGALAVGFTFLVGQKLLGKETAVTGALIFSLLPLGIGYSQLITLEPVIMCLTAVVLYFFVRYLEERTKKYALITGIFLGCAFATKFTNILLLPILFGFWLCWSLYAWKVEKKPFFTRNDLWMGIIPVLGVIVFFALWPALWFHAKETFANISHWSQLRMQPATEYYFGTLQPVPWHYYLGSLLVTTPVLVLLFSIIGMVFSWQNKSEMRKGALLATWLFVPLLLSFYPLRQNGIRYVIMLYPALGLYAGYGLVRTLQAFKVAGKEAAAYIYLIFFGILGLSLYFVYPYYLDYYNFLTGGNVAVYQKRLFELGSWGQGQREALLLLGKNVRPGSTVGLAVTPDYVAPNVDSLRIGMYDPNFKFDYIVTNTFREVRSTIKEDVEKAGYVPIHYVTAGGAPLVTIYQRK